MSSKRNYFTNLEKDFILELVHKYGKILESKKTDYKSIKCKKDTWEKVTNEFNAQSGVNPRDSKQVKKCWENIKNRWKEAKGQERRERLLTGGGPEPAPIDGASNVVDGIIHSQTEPLKNSFDDDAGEDDLDSQATESDEESLETSNPVPAARRQSVIISGGNPPSEMAMPGKRKASTELCGAPLTTGKRKATLDNSASTITKNVANRQAPAEPTNPPSKKRNNKSLTYAQREVISLQQEEHKLQMQILTTKLENCQAEHKLKMEILALQKQVLERQLGKAGINESSRACSQPDSSQNVAFGINNILGI